MVVEEKGAVESTYYVVDDPQIQIHGRFDDNRHGGFSSPIQTGQYDPSFFPLVHPAVHLHPCSNRNATCPVLTVSPTFVYF